MNNYVRTIVLNLIPVFCFSQEDISFKHFSSKDGLSFDYVTTVFQDSKGYMWFGTEALGLNRYDGYNFKIYLDDPDDPQSLKHTDLRYITEDRSGHLWIATTGGVFKMDPKTEEFLQFEHDPKDPTSLSNNYTYFILEDKLGYIWIATTAGGLNRMDPKSGHFQRYLHNPNDSSSISSNHVVTLHEDTNGQLWIGTREGLNLYDRENDNFARFLNEEPSQRIMVNSTSNTVHDILEDDDKYLWLDHGSHLVRLNPVTMQFEFFDLGIVSYIRSIVPDARDSFWIATYQDGLFKFDKKTRQYIQLRSNDGSGLKSDRINQIYKDRSGDLWLALGYSGVNKIENNKPGFKVYQIPANKDASVWTSSIADDGKGNTWIGNNRGVLTKLDRTNGEIKNYSYKTPSLHRYNSIDDIHIDSNGILWLGTWGGLVKLDPHNGASVTYIRDQHFPNSLQNNRVQEIYEDISGNIWIGYMSDAISKLTLNKRSGFNRSIVDYKHYYPYPSAVTQVDIEADKYGGIWFGTFLGLYKFDHKRDRFIPYLSDQSNPHSITNNMIVDIYKGKSDELIVSSIRSLMKIVPVGPNISEEDSVKFIQVAKGVPGVLRLGLLQDNSENFWSVIGADQIAKFNLETKFVRAFDSDDGVTALMGSFQNDYGEIFYGNKEGFMVFHPDSIKDNLYIPPVVFTDFQISNESIALGDSLDGKPILTSVIDRTGLITLPHGQNFTFEFAALNFTNPKNNQYSYKLEGFDKEWSPPSTTRTATYTNLWEGSYTFRVRGSNNDGVWNNEGTSIKVTILPPLWRTWWAYTGYALIFLGTLLAIFRFFIIRERLKGNLKLEHMELEKVKELDRVKTQFFANVSHEFRTPLTLILGPLRQIKEGTFKGDVDSVIGVMIRNSKRLLHLINQLLDFSKLEAGAVSLEASVGDLVEFMRSMFAAFESTAQQREIRYIFQSDVSTLPTYYDRDKLEKVIINLLSNAFKFTKDEGSITVKMNKKIADPTVDKGEGVVEISIEDSGKGIPEDKLPHVFDRFYQVDTSPTRAQEGTGIGLALAKELIELHNGSITVESKRGKGSTFIVHLPLGRSHLSDDQVIVRKGYQPIDKNAIEALPEHIFRDLNIEDDPVNSDQPLLLIIDDNEDMRLYLKEVLSQEYQLIEAANGVKGWEVAQEKIPDLVISDVMMPEMDGQELCQKLKTDERTSHIPVVLLTARAGDEAKLEGLETGADDYITKPFSPVELKVRIHNLIELRQKLREQFSRNLSLEPKDVTITSTDERFLQRAMDIMEIHRSDADFSAENFIKEIGMSRTQLHRKLKALTDQSAGEFIRTYRLKYARQLIQKDYGNMAQVAYECGFNNPSYFAECFKKQFGVLPSEFAKSQ